MADAVSDLLVAIMGGLVGGTFVLFGHLLQGRRMRRLELRARSEAAARAILDSVLELDSIIERKDARTSDQELTKEARQQMEPAFRNIGIQAILISDAEMRERIREKLAFMRWTEPMRSRISDYLDGYSVMTMLAHYLVDEIGAYLRGEKLPADREYVILFREAHTQEIAEIRERAEKFNAALDAKSKGGSGNGR